jgi:hypothetical protein
MGTADRRPALQRRSTDESSGIVRNSGIRGASITGELIAGELTVYEPDPDLWTDDFREKQDN